jgi:glycosyltransferase involved in cell wall biosynthesis
VFRVPFYVFRGSAKSLLAFCCVFPVAAAATWIRIRCSKPDVVNLHFAGANALYVLLGLLGTRIPLVVTLHGGEVTDGSSSATLGYSQVEERLTRAIVTALLGRANFVTAVSQALIDSARGVRPEVLTRSRRVFMGGYADDEATPDTIISGFFVLAVGRLSREKGFDVLVEAFAEVARGEPSLALVIVGDGPERGHLESRVRELGVAPRVRFAGAVTKAEVRPYYRGCAFLAVPSRWEGAGSVVWEAFVHGKPVVASRVGGLPELVIHGTTGLLVPPGDTHQLAQAVIRLAECSELRETYGRNAATFAGEHADWCRVAREYECIYQGVQGRASPPARA